MESNGMETKDTKVPDSEVRSAKDHQTHSAPAEDLSAPKKRRKVNHACIYCRRSERPCLRCIKRNIGHLCHDEPRDPDVKKPKTSADEPEIQADRGRTSLDQGAGGMGPPPSFDAGSLGPGNPLQLVPPGSAAGMLGRGMSNNVNQFAGFSDAWFTAQNHLRDMQNYHPNLLIAPEVSSEFNLLNDFLHSSLLDDGAALPDDHGMLRNSQQADMLANFQGENSGTLIAPSAIRVSGADSLYPTVEQGDSISRPTSVVPLDKTREYYLQAADPSGNDTPEERMQRVLRAKYEAGLLKPFNYVKGYLRLSKYLDSHVETATKQKILRQLDRFRPKFREKMHALTDMDLVYVEMWFEKTLMEYDRVFASMAVPACCWRRTGEIFRGNKEMAELIHVPVERLRDGKIALHEILTEESVVRYWEEFGTIAFDPAHDTLLTACSLKSPDDRSNDPIVNCCLSFMIRRDEHKVPTLIVGNFLPHDPHPR